MPNATTTEEMGVRKLPSAGPSSSLRELLAELSQPEVDAEAVLAALDELRGWVSEGGACACPRVENVGRFPEPAYRVTA